jgi:hypothetical protein
MRMKMRMGKSMGKSDEGATDSSVSEMTSQMAIRSLAARYSDAASRRDTTAWGDTWATSSEWHLLGIETRGRDAIVAHWRKLMAGIPFVLQVPVSGIIEVLTADSASGRWYIHEITKRPGRDRLTLGVYHDRYIREDGEWRFALRRFDVLYAGPPDLSGDAFPFPTDLPSDLSMNHAPDPSISPALRS